MEVLDKMVDSNNTGLSVWIARFMDVFQYLVFKQEHLLLGVGIDQYSVQVTGWTVQGTNPARGNRFIFCPKRSDRPSGPPSFLFSGYRVTFPRS